MKPYIQLFPDELLLEIFSKVSPKDLLNVKETCQRWSYVVRDWSLWRTLELSEEAETYSVQQIRDILELAGPHVTEASIAASLLDRSNELGREVCSLTRRLCAGLHTLAIHFDEDSVFTLCSHMNETISVANCGRSHLPSTISTLSVRVPLYVLWRGTSGMNPVQLTRMDNIENLLIEVIAPDISSESSHCTGLYWAIHTVMEFHCSKAENICN